MPGEPDPQYVRARRVLLDAADALAAHLDSVVLVGAQAVYLHTGEAELFDAAAPYATDADLAIGPADLADSPLLDELLIRRGFTLRESPGRWVSPDGIYVDLMVPEALAGPRRRAQRRSGHDRSIAHCFGVGPALSALTPANFLA